MTKSTNTGVIIEFLLMVFLPGLDIQKFLEQTMVASEFQMSFKHFLVFRKSLERSFSVRFGRDMRTKLPHLDYSAAKP